MPSTLYRFLTLIKWIIIKVIPRKRIVKVEDSVLLILDMCYQRMVVKVNRPEPWSWSAKDSAPGSQYFLSNSAQYYYVWGQVSSYLHSITKKLFRSKWVQYIPVGTAMVYGSCARNWYSSFLIKISWGPREYSKKIIQSTHKIICNKVLFQPGFSCHFYFIKLQFSYICWA